VLSLTLREATCHVVEKPRQQGSEFSCQPPQEGPEDCPVSEIEEESFPSQTLGWLQPWPTCGLQPCQGLWTRKQISNASLLDPQVWEIVNVCCFKLLFCYTAIGNQSTISFLWYLLCFLPSLSTQSLRWKPSPLTCSWSPTPVDSTYWKFSRSALSHCAISHPFPVLVGNHLAQGDARVIFPEYK
jgi:hypothetical protein